MCFSKKIFFIYWQGYIPPNKIPDRFQVHAETVDDDNKLTYCTGDIPKTLDSNRRALIQLNMNTPTCISGRSSLKSHRKYNAMIVAKNDFGEDNSTGKIPFSKSVGINTTQKYLVHIFQLLFEPLRLYNCYHSSPIKDCRNITLSEGQ